MPHPSDNIFENGEFERLCSVATQSVQETSLDPNPAGLSGSPRDYFPTPADAINYRLAPEKHTQVHYINPGHGRAVIGPFWDPQFMFPVEHPCGREYSYELYKTHLKGAKGGSNMERSQSASHDLPMAPPAQQFNVPGYQPQQQFKPMGGCGIAMARTQSAPEHRQHDNVQIDMGRMQYGQLEAPGQFASASDQFSSTPDQFSSALAQFPSRPDQFSATSGQFSSASDQFSSKPGQFSSTMNQSSNQLSSALNQSSSLSNRLSSALNQCSSSSSQSMSSSNQFSSVGVPPSLTPATISKHKPPPPFCPPTVASGIATTIGARQKMVELSPSPEIIEIPDSPQNPFQHEPLVPHQFQRQTFVDPNFLTKQIVPVVQELVAPFEDAPVIEGFNSYSCGADLTLLVAAGSSDDLLASLHDYSY